MQILRIPLLACAAAICVTPILVHAYDNENQLRARQALEQKMKELGTQPVPETSAPPVTVVAPEPAPAQKAAKPKKESKSQPPKQVPAPAVVEQKPVTVTTTEPMVVFTAPGEAPKEMPQSSAVLITPGEPAQPVPSMQAIPPAAPAMPEPVMPAPAAPPQVVVRDAGKSQQLEDALHQKMATSQPTTIVQPQPTTMPAPQHTNGWQQPYVVAPSQQHTTVVVKPAPGVPEATPLTLAPLTGPASSLSASKEQRLEQLLQLYRADQITPQQYHDQRAKILSEP